MKALLTLVVLLMISLHLHLWWEGRDRGVPANAAIVEEGPRPILLEESTLRSLVRDEVARGIGATGLTEQDLQALSLAIENAVREGLAGAQIRESIAQEYVAGYYDALAEIERLEAARAEAEEGQWTGQ